MSKPNHDIYRNCKNCKKPFKLTWSSEIYCCEKCKEEYHKKKHPRKYKKSKFKIKCCIKECEEHSVGFLNNKHYCEIHFKQEKKISDFIIKQEKNQKKYHKKPKPIWICEKCRDVIPSVRGKIQRFCKKCKEKRDEKRLI